ncbi:MAG: hypothetical protein H7Z19_02580, partial [Chitinophagaceae bacterium]|nr:hypothetical protein [Rubrivivax sp.]
MKLLHALLLTCALLQASGCARLATAANESVATATPSQSAPWTLLPVSQPAEAVLTITTPDAPQRLLPLGSSARFRIAFRLDPYPAEGVVARLKLGPEQLESAEREVRVPAEGLEVTAAPQTRPGFVRCTASATVAGQTLREWTTVGFAPDRIEATQTEPADFDAFWAGQKAALDRIPLDL